MEASFELEQARLALESSHDDVPEWHFKILTEDDCFEVPSYPRLAWQEFWFDNMYSTDAEVIAALEISVM